MMGSGLPFLGCPTLAGSADKVQKEPEQKWSQAEKPEAKGEGGKGSQSSKIYMDNGGWLCRDTSSCSGTGRRR